MNIIQNITNKVLKYYNYISLSLFNINDDNEMIIFGGADGVLKIYEMKSMKLLGSFETKKAILDIKMIN